MILTFSGLHFLFYMTPLNFQQGLVQPPVEQKWSKRITVQCRVACLMRYENVRALALKSWPLWPGKRLLDNSINAVTSQEK